MTTSSTDVLKGKNMSEDIIKKAIEGAIPDFYAADAASLTEAYVAQPKHYDLPAESVSQQTKEAHLELYNGYVESLNRVAAELEAVQRVEANSRSSRYRSLKQDETYLLNATYLHELYFANGFDPSSDVYESSLACMRLSRDWGDFDRWQRDFYACALSAREGWVVTGFNTFLKKYATVFIDGHSASVPVGFYPTIVVDMWDHASKDFSDKREYIVSQMRELNWDVIEERFLRAEKIAEAVK